MTGTLQRLFSFARAAESRPLENFTTEALAIAIQAEPNVFVEALADAGLVRARGSRGAVRVETQVHVPNGVVDLVVALQVEGQRLTFWVEVKAHAGLHGPQLQTYLDAANQYPGDSPRPVVLMLCKRPITDSVPTLRWNQLRERVDDSSHIYWRDLRRFLEDNRMADDYDRPITPAELRALPAAHALLRKTSRIATDFLASLPVGAGWERSEFPTTRSKATATITQQFRQHRRLVLHSRRYPWVMFGFTFDPDPKLEVWIEFRPTDFEARDAVFAVAKAGEMLGTWAPRADGWPSLGSSTPVSGGLDHEFARDWLTKRFAELESSGVFAELPKWRRQGRVGATRPEDDETTDP